MHKPTVWIPPTASSSLPDAPSDQYPDSNSEGLSTQGDCELDPPVNSIYGGTAASVQPVHQTAPYSQNSGTSGSPGTVTNTTNWSTPLQTVLDQPPATFPQKMMLGGLVFCLSFGAWATFGQIEEVGHARGRLVPDGEAYKIHPVELGKVASIAVKEGQAVKAGQELVELDTELAKGEVERLEQLLNAQKIEFAQKAALLDKMRLEAQTRDKISQADIEAQQAAIAQAQAKAAALRGQLTQHQSSQVASHNRLERLEPLPSKAQELLAQQQAETAALAARLERLKPLLEQGAISKELVFQAEQSLMASQRAITRTQLEEGTTTKEQVFQAQQNLRDRASAIVQSHGELQQAIAQIDQLQAGLTQKQAEGYRTQIETQQKLQQLQLELSQLKAEIADKQNLLSSAKTKFKQKFLYAPVDGIVSSLNIRNVGEVVQPGQSIAEIAPKDAPLVLTASLPNQEAGFVKPNMPAQIKFDAYPYQDYGIVTGKITKISPDAKPDEKLGAVYQVRVVLDRNYVIANDRTIHFKAGQTATAEIIIRRRRIADFLLDPFRQLQKGGIKI